jgi:hypothetical protein
LKACDFENKKFNTQRDFGSSLFSFSQGLWCGAGPMWLYLLCVFVVGPRPQIVRAARRFVGDICLTGLAHMQEINWRDNSKICHLILFLLNWFLFLQVYSLDLYWIVLIQNEIDRRRTPKVRHGSGPGHTA